MSFLACVSLKQDSVLGACVRNWIHLEPKSEVTKP
jgi:hypothetical protein